MSRHEDRLIKTIASQFDRQSSVLDVGCGIGNKLALFQQSGFSDLTGVEKNPALVKRACERGFNVLTPEEFETNSDQRLFDIVVMSHIVEHFSYQDLKPFMEYYLRHLKGGGHLVIATPVLQDVFYDDFDHVKPYGPRGIQQVFGGNDAQVQFYSDFELKLEDIRYVREAFQLKFVRALTLRNQWYRLPRAVNQILHLIHRLSFRSIGRTVSWIGVFRKQELGKIERAPAT